MFAPNGEINKNAKLLLNMGQVFMPYEYTGSQDELMACRKTAWLGSFLNISPVYDISGPDAVRLLNKVCVNRDFAKLKIGKSRHAILCNEKGQMLADGVLMRKSEDCYRTYWLAPVLAYYAETMGMDVKGTWVHDEFFFQIDGPKSLEIMETASRQDLHGLKFAQNTQITIENVPVTIHRLGMSGCLAYEMHGPMQEAEKVFGAIAEAGEVFGIRKLGFSNYCRNHTQGGYPNQWIHFWYPLISTEDGLTQYIMQNPEVNPMCRSYNFAGSASDNLENAFVTPYDVGWGYLVNFDHDFIGKGALQKLSENPPKQAVTLEWNAEDVGKAFATQFCGAEVDPCDDLSSVGDGGGDTQPIISKVVTGENMIGVTTGRLHDYYHRRMISLAFIEKEYAQDGRELVVVWGSNPASAVKIRARVAAFPYYNEELRNETFDVEKIPHPVFA